MEGGLLQATPGDPKLIEDVVNRLKSQGTFDNLRKECLADVDTKPAYQNLRQRVETYVAKFLEEQKWSPDLNKNQLRDGLRKQINHSGMLASGVDRIIDQVVQPKIYKVFKPEIDKVMCEVLGLDPMEREENEKKRQELLVKYQQQQNYQQQMVQQQAKRGPNYQQGFQSPMAQQPFIGANAGVRPQNLPGNFAPRMMAPQGFTQFPNQQALQQGIRTQGPHLMPINAFGQQQNFLNFSQQAALQQNIRANLLLAQQQAIAQGLQNIMSQQTMLPPGIQPLQQGVLPTLPGVQFNQLALQTSQAQFGLPRPTFAVQSTSGITPPNFSPMTTSSPRAPKPQTGGGTPVSSAPSGAVTPGTPVTAPSASPAPAQSPALPPSPARGSSPPPLPPPLPDSETPTEIEGPKTPEGPEPDSEKVEKEKVREGPKTPKEKGEFSTKSLPKSEKSKVRESSQSRDSPKLEKQLPVQKVKDNQKSRSSPGIEKVKKEDSSRESSPRLDKVKRDGSSSRDSPKSDGSRSVKSDLSGKPMKYKEGSRDSRSDKHSHDRLKSKEIGRKERSGSLEKGKGQRSSEERLRIGEKGLPGDRPKLHKHGSHEDKLDRLAGKLSDRRPSSDKHRSDRSRTMVEENRPQGLPLAERDRLRRLEKAKLSEQGFSERQRQGDRKLGIERHSAKSDMADVYRSEKVKSSDKMKGFGSDRPKMPGDRVKVEKSRLPSEKGKMHDLDRVKSGSLKSEMFGKPGFKKSKDIKSEDMPRGPKEIPLEKVSQSMDPRLGDVYKREKVLGDGKDRYGERSDPRSGSKDRRKIGEGLDRSKHLSQSERHKSVSKEYDRKHSSKVRKDLQVKHSKGASSVKVEKTPEKQYDFAWKKLTCDQLSDISVSSVHTSDLSSFEGEISDLESDDREIQKRKMEAGIEIKQEPMASKESKPPPRDLYTDSEEEEGIYREPKPSKKPKSEREKERQRRRSEIEEKLRELDEKKRQLKEECRKLREIEKKNAKEGKVKEEIQVKKEESSEERRMPNPQSPLKRSQMELKEHLKEQKVFEKKMALRRQRTRNKRYTSEEFTSIFTEGQKFYKKKEETTTTTSGDESRSRSATPTMDEQRYSSSGKAVMKTEQSNIPIYEVTSPRKVNLGKYFHGRMSPVTPLAIKDNDYYETISSGDSILNSPNSEISEAKSDDFEDLASEKPEKKSKLVSPLKEEAKPKSHRSTTPIESEKPTSKTPPLSVARSSSSRYDVSDLYKPRTSHRRASPSRAATEDIPVAPKASTSKEEPAKLAVKQEVVKPAKEAKKVPKPSPPKPDAKKSLGKSYKEEDLYKPRHTFLSSGRRRSLLNRRPGMQDVTTASEQKLFDAHKKFSSKFMPADTSKGKKRLRSMSPLKGTNNLLARPRAKATKGRPRKRAKVAPSREGSPEPELPSRVQRLRTHSPSESVSRPSTPDLTIDEQAELLAGSSSDSSPSTPGFRPKSPPEEPEKTPQRIQPGAPRGAKVSIKISDVVAMLRREEAELASLAEHGPGVTSPRSDTSTPTMDEPEEIPSSNRTKRRKLEEKEKGQTEAGETSSEKTDVIWKRSEGGKFDDMSDVSSGELIVDDEMISDEDLLSVSESEEETHLPVRKAPSHVEKSYGETERLKAIESTEEISSDELENIPEKPEDNFPTISGGVQQDLSVVETTRVGRDFFGACEDGGLSALDILANSALSAAAAESVLPVSEQVDESAVPVDATASVAQNVAAVLEKAESAVPVDTTASAAQNVAAVSEKEESAVPVDTTASAAQNIAATEQADGSERADLTAEQMGPAELAPVSAPLEEAETLEESTSSDTPGVSGGKLDVSPIIGSDETVKDLPEEASKGDKQVKESLRQKRVESEPKTESDIRTSDDPSAEHGDVESGRQRESEQVQSEEPPKADTVGPGEEETIQPEVPSDSRKNVETEKPVELPSRDGEPEEPADEVGSGEFQTIQPEVPPSGFRKIVETEKPVELTSQDAGPGMSPVAHSISEEADVTPPEDKSKREGRESVEDVSSEDKMQVEESMKKACEEFAQESMEVSSVSQENKESVLGEKLDLDSEGESADSASKDEAAVGEVEQAKELSVERENLQSREVTPELSSKEMEKQEVENLAVDEPVEMVDSKAVELPADTVVEPTSLVAQDEPVRSSIEDASEPVPKTVDQSSMDDAFEHVHKTVDQSSMEDASDHVPKTVDRSSMEDASEHVPETVEQTDAADSPSSDRLPQEEKLAADTSSELREMSSSPALIIDENVDKEKDTEKSECDEIQEDGKTEQNFDDTRTVDASLEMRVEDMPSGTQVVDTQVDIRFEDTQVDTRVEDTPSDTRVEDTQVDTRVEDTQVDTRVEDTQVDTRVEGTQVDTRVEGTQVDTRVEDTSKMEEMQEDDQVKETGEMLAVMPSHTHVEDKSVQEASRTVETQNGQAQVGGTSEETSVDDQVEEDEEVEDTSREARVQDTSSDTRVEDTSSEVRVEDTSHDTLVEDTSSNTRVEDTSSDTRVEGTSSETRVEDTTSEARVEDTSSEARVEDTTSEARVEDTPHDTRVEDTPDDTRVEDAPSETPVEDTTSEVGVEDTSHDTPVENTSDDTRVEDTASDTRVEDTCNSNKAVVEDTSDDTRVEDTCGGTRVEDTSDDTRVEDASSDTRVKDNSNKARVEDTSDDTRVDDTSNDTGVEDTSSKAYVENTSHDTRVGDTSDDTRVEDTSGDTGAEDACTTSDTRVEDTLSDTPVDDTSSGIQVEDTSRTAPAETLKTEETLEVASESEDGSHDVQVELPECEHEKTGELEDAANPTEMEPSSSTKRELRTNSASPLPDEGSSSHCGGTETENVESSRSHDEQRGSPPPEELRRSRRQSKSSTVSESRSVSPSQKSDSSARRSRRQSRASVMSEDQTTSPTRSLSPAEHSRPGTPSVLPQQGPPSPPGGQGYSPSESSRSSTPTAGARKGRPRRSDAQAAAESGPAAKRQKRAASPTVKRESLRSYSPPPHYGTRRAGKGKEEKKPVVPGKRTKPVSPSASPAPARATRGQKAAPAPAVVVKTRGRQATAAAAAGKSTTATAGKSTAATAGKSTAATAGKSTVAAAGRNTPAGKRSTRGSKDEGPPSKRGRH